MAEFTDLIGAHVGRKVYVIGSGATLDYIRPGFFDGEVVIATNSVAHRLNIYPRCTVYTHGCHHEDIHALAPVYRNHVFITPMGNGGHAGEPEVEYPNVTYYRHKPTEWEFDPVAQYDPTEVDLVVGSTSLHGSMHLAALMGATDIILVGADCGLLDGGTNQSGYVSGNLAPGHAIPPLEWLSRWEGHLRMMTDFLRTTYEVGVCSLNPFASLNLEGHRFESLDVMR